MKENSNSLSEQTLSEQNEKVQSYWINRFNENPWAWRSILPYDHKPTQKPRKSEVISTSLTNTLSDAILRLSNQSKIRLLVILSTGTCVLLRYLTSKEKQLIGTPVVVNENTNNTINSILPLLIRISPKASFKELLATVKAEVHNAIKHQDFPIQELPEILNWTQDHKAIPLFEIGVSLASLQNPTVLWPLETKLNFHFEHHENSILFKVEYEVGTYVSSTIHRVMELYQRLLNLMIQSPEAPIGSIPVTNEKELRLITHEWQGTKNTFLHQNFLEAFASCVAHYGNRPAIVGDGETVTYEKLDRESNRLAHVLRNHGITKDNLVIIWAEKKNVLITAMLAVWKAGAAFLPVSHDTPTERFKFIFHDSDARAILTCGNVHLPPEVDVCHIALEDIDKHYENDNDPEIEVGQLAYVIYTSGSSGAPKGVLISHEGLQNLCDWHNTYFGITKNERMGQFSGIGFDAFIWDVFPYLEKGASIYIIPSPELQDPQSLNTFFQKNEITITFLPTPVYEQFCEIDNTSLRILLTGADKLRKYTAKNYKVYNNYGPTECTVVSTTTLVEQEEHNIPIGRPVDNCQIYILDRDNRSLLAPGMIGELCVAGKGLSLGYLNRPNLTKENFISHPDLQDIKLYRTGDLGRWREDGTLEFMGRIDRQVKFRGYRIELQEIENILIQQDEVSRAFVKLDREELCAYIESSSAGLDKELTHMLKPYLPEYMIPTKWIIMDAFPKDSAGRINQQQLLGTNPQTIYSHSLEKPQGIIEEKLLEIWRLLLEKDNIGVTDKFFKIGGHSLQATKLLAKIHNQFSIHISLRDFYLHSSIRELAILVQKEWKNNFYTIPKQPEKRQRFPMSFSQFSIWSQQKIQGDSTGFHMPGVFEINGVLEIPPFKKALAYLIQRHVALRTVFRVENEEPIQLVLEIQEAHLSIVDLSDQEDPLTSALSHTDEEVNKTFDLERGPLIRFTLFILNQDHYLLLVNMHHIISDEWTLNILFSDTLQAYTDLRQGKTPQLTPLKIQYTDYSVWHHEKVNSGEIIEFENYWRQHFSGQIPKLELLTDRLRQEGQAPKGAHIDFLLRTDLTTNIYEYSRSHEGTPFHVLLACTAALLKNLSGNSDLIIGAPVLGREHPDLQGIAGFFVNTLPLRLQIHEDHTLAHIFKQAKHQTQEASYNQVYPVDRLIEWLGKNRASSQFPLYSVVMVVQDLEAEERRKAHLEKISELSWTPHSVVPREGKFDLIFYFGTKSNQIEASIEYDAALFDEDTIELFRDRFLKLTDALFAYPNQSIETISRELEKKEGQNMGQNTVPQVKF